ncbi:MAG: chorismate--pyruvate lyase family protein [Janthinobacterium lividum]
MPDGQAAQRIKHQRWLAHAPGLRRSSTLWHWLGDHGSLTARLTAHCQAFRVLRLCQRSAVALKDEARALGLPQRARVIERDVLLFADQRAVIFAHTVMALDASRSDWPYFSALGNRSIGNRLFNDPAVTGGGFAFARLHARHPLMVRAALALGVPAMDQPLHARRRIFQRRNGQLMITEVFLDCALWSP